MRKPIGRRNSVLKAIFVSDMHLREDIPECRTDDFIEAQTEKLRWLSGLQKQNQCPVLIAGDLFDKWKPSPWLLAYALRELPDGIIAIAGQHDLPAHNLDEINRSGIEVLASAGKIELLEPARSIKTRTKDFLIYGFSWGVELENVVKNGIFKIAVVHKLIYKAKEPPFPGAEEVGSTCKAIAKQLSGFNIIVTGDNHQTIFEEHNGTAVINCGSFMRTTAKQIDFEPSIFALTEDDNIIQIKIPIRKGVVSREHLEKVADKDERIAAFAERLNHKIEIGLSFTDNLKRYMSKNKINNDVQNIVWGCVDA